jgi:hypothetical protein
LTRTVTAASDRLLCIVAPKAQAAASCRQRNYLRACYCYRYDLYMRWCSIDYFCHESCGGCFRTNAAC